MIRTIEFDDIAAVEASLKNLRRYNQAMYISVDETFINKELAEPYFRAEESSADEISLEKMIVVKDSSAMQSTLIENTKNSFNVLEESIIETGNNSHKISLVMQELQTQSSKLLDTLSNLSAISEEDAASAEECTASVETLDATMDDVVEKVNALEQNKNDLIKYISFFEV